MSYLTFTLKSELEKLAMQVDENYLKLDKRVKSAEWNLMNTKIETREVVTVSNEQVQQCIRDCKSFKTRYYNEVSEVGGLKQHERVEIIIQL